MTVLISIVSGLSSLLGQWDICDQLQWDNGNDNHTIPVFGEAITAYRKQQ